MIGVVVWSQERREKAIIWCEDHKSLAYLQSRADMRGDVDWPATGDMIELDSETIGDMRLARNVRMLPDCRCAQIPEMLAASAATAEPRLRVVSEREPAARPRRSIGALFSAVG